MLEFILIIISNLEILLSYTIVYIVNHKPAKITLKIQKL